MTAIWTLLLLLPSLLLPAAANEEQHGNLLRDLLPDQPRLGERLLCGHTQLYRVLDLHPDRVYDVKVSYAASLPTTFALQVERVLLPLPVAGNGRGDVAPPIIPPRRRLLNTVKLQLRPQELENHHAVRFRLDQVDSDALQVELSLRAEVEGVSVSHVSEERECVFDIAVEELLLQAIPRHALVLVAWLLVMLLASKRWLLPYLENKIALNQEEDRLVAVGSKDA
ncbi:hypothetical protein BBJ28_00012021 [Nothophytophthora sp. Chile5]|nr:hypothetical protein BBJ28_00012021 [Nothophytophthora sp. Chile5]